jgi:hypothetical protein
MLVNFMAVRSILLTFRIFHGPLVHFVVIWCIFPVLGCHPKTNLATLITSLVHTFAFDTAAQKIAVSVSTSTSAAAEGPSIKLKSEKTSTRFDDEILSRGECHMAAST